MAASSRLDRLILLLEKGTTPATKKAAAEQIGQVVKLHPHELQRLLARIQGYLRAKSWDTRIAAGQAYDAIARQIPQWDPTPSENVSTAPGSTPATMGGADGQLSFDSFEILAVLSTANPLLGSQGLEYEVDEEFRKLDPKERLRKQRLNLKKQLGLDTGGGSGDVVPSSATESADIEKLFDADDLTLQTSTSDDGQNKRKRDEPEKKSTEPKVDLSGMSARERNRARRLAKQKAKVSARAVDVPTVRTASSAGAAGKSKVTEQTDPNKLVVETASDVADILVSADEWPFQARSEELCNDLFHAQWEYRHGAAIGLRELIKTHGAGAGKTTDATADAMSASHRAWLVDMALRLLCVCALDRFGDYMSDVVVAPVRDTTAQALGAVVKFMTPADVRRVLAVLLELQKHTHWQVRHGGLLGVKYLVAVRADLVATLLDALLPVITAGLEDESDDVRAAAADALLPISDQVVTTRPQSVTALLDILWDALLDLDDLAVSTSSVLALLSDLVAVAARRRTDAAAPGAALDRMLGLVPRLFPFFRHALTSVRAAVLRTLSSLCATAADLRGANVNWLGEHLFPLLRLTYQNYLVEEADGVLEQTAALWATVVAAMPCADLAEVMQKWTGAWLGLLSTASGAPLAATTTLVIRHRNDVHDGATTDAPTGATEPEQQSRKRRRKEKKFMDSVGPAGAPRKKPVKAKALMGGASQETEPNEARVLQARTAAATALGTALATCSRGGGAANPTASAAVDVCQRAVLEMLELNSGVRRHCGALVVLQWAHALKDSGVTLPPPIHARLVKMLTDTSTSDVSFAELDVFVSRMRSQVSLLLQAYSVAGVDVPRIAAVGKAKDFTVAAVNTLLTTTCPSWDTLLNASGNGHKNLGARRVRGSELRDTVQALQDGWHLRKRLVQAAVAGAVIASGTLTPSLNAVIKPLMESVKREAQLLAQEQSAQSLALLLLHCRALEKCPNAKIVKNLASMLCKDPSITPQMDSLEGSEPNAILALVRDRDAAQQQQPPAVPVTKPPSDDVSAAAATATAALGGGGAALSDERVAHRGGACAFRAVAVRCGPDLATLVPAVPATVDTALAPLAADARVGDATVLQRAINGMQVLETLSTALDAALAPRVTAEWLPIVFRAVTHPDASVRHKAATCVAACAEWTHGTIPVVQAVIDVLLPLLGDTRTNEHRLGVSETLFLMVERLQLKIVPFIVVLVIPLLGRMSDFVQDVREIISRTFAMLMVYMPLEAGTPNPPGMAERLIAQKNKDRHFLDQLMDSSKLEHYKLPKEVSATLRSYQQDGLNWMHFLNKYQLHGVLCDDMGLGKTLQSICIIVGSHLDRAAKHRETHAPDTAHLPSLVVCPSTLTDHWFYEFRKFCPSFRVLRYAGSSASARRELRAGLTKHDVVVLSYNTVRSEREYFSTVAFNYCILDEGHIIKNPKSMITQAVKAVQANHRIILSGTPIQNNVLELWSLFDYLMPGFLGTEEQFKRTYSKPISKSREAKASSGEHEAGTLALERLHRQVLPFILRRMKEDVLADLPPKIIQDYHCELSPLQLRLYEAFAKSQVASAVDSAAAAPTEKNHIFQVLQYLKKVCNHPAFVLTPEHPWYANVTKQLRREGSSLADIRHAAKIAALRQLLLDCGIGTADVRVKTEASGTTEDAIENVVGQHRCLVFAQSKRMLDVIARDLLHKHLPSVTYLRLDGSVPPAKRHAIVDAFNGDPSVDLLLLTTSVGGLGLTLTGADTVIFMEHDWNPSKDLQAMDRAHRIGQKKVVNVYRLITKGTLEEKIMGLQEFKKNIASTVISKDNASLSAMGTDQLLDLFEVSDNSGDGDGDESSDPKQPMTLQQALKHSDAYDEDEYGTEFSMESFLASVKSGRP
eukprot:m.1575863 g.1575863  ORF g.1575863 m.1575863 type:complete len:1877 (-) comp25308_c0_seq54:5766-11396(-)